MHNLPKFIAALDPILLVDYPLGTLFWCIHHESMVGELRYPLRNRIEMIHDLKPPGEWPIRFEALRPVKEPGKIPPVVAAAVALKARCATEFETAFATEPRAFDDYMDYMVAERGARGAILAHYSQLLAQWDSEYPGHPEFRPETGLVMPQHALADPGRVIQVKNLD